MPFFLFSWWNHPTSDDYIIGVRRYAIGFWQLQRFFYRGWSGRYFATLVSSIFSYPGLLYRYYFLSAAILFIATFGAWLFLLNRANRFFFRCKYAFPTRVVFAIIMLILEIDVVPEVNTAFYWFSSAVTYQLPLIILLLLAGVAVRIFSRINYRLADIVSLVLLTACIHGCNEVFSICFLLMSTAFTAACLLAKSHRKLAIGWWLSSLLSACFLLLAPGIMARSQLMPTGSLPVTVVLSLVKFAALNWFFLKEPLWWALAAVTFIAARNKSSDLSNNFKKILQRISLGTCALLYFSSGMIIYFPILLVTNGSLPMRAENIICFLCSLFSLGGMYLLVSKYSAARQLKPFASFAEKHVYLLFAVVVFCTPNMQLIIRTLSSGYFYNEVMLDRKAALIKAGLEGASVVTLNDYDLSLDKKIRESLPWPTRATLLKMIRQKPPLIFFEDNLANKKLIQRFYGIDTLILRTR